VTNSIENVVIHCTIWKWLLCNWIFISTMQLMQYSNFHEKLAALHNTSGMTEIIQVQIKHAGNISQW